MHLLLNNLRIYMKMNKTDRPPFEFVQREPFAQRPMIYIYILYYTALYCEKRLLIKH